MATDRIQGVAVERPYLHNEPERKVVPKKKGPDTFERPKDYRLIQGSGSVSAARYCGPTPSCNNPKNHQPWTEDDGFRFLAADVVRLKAEKEADAMGLAGEAREAFMRPSKELYAVFCPFGGISEAPPAKT